MGIRKDHRIVMYRKKQARPFTAPASVVVVVRESPGGRRQRHRRQTLGGGSLAVALRRAYVSGHPKQMTEG